MHIRPLYVTRVSHLESFRFWMHGSDERNEMYNNESNFVKGIQGIWAGSDKAAYGTSGHSIIENPKANINGGFEIKTFEDGQENAFKFTKEQAAPIMRYVADHPYMTHETSVSKLYHTNDFDIIVTGTIDRLEGSFIRDNKFKFGSVDIDYYNASMQHRYYMDMIGMRHFFYDFFRVRKFKDKNDCAKAVIEDVETLYVPWNEAMTLEIQDNLQEFVDYVVFKGLEDCLIITMEKYKKIIKGDVRLGKVIQDKLKEAQL